MAESAARRHELRADRDASSQQPATTWAPGGPQPRGHALARVFVHASAGRDGRAARPAAEEPHADRAVTHAAGNQDGRAQADRAVGPAAEDWHADRESHSRIGQP